MDPAQATGKPGEQLAVPVQRGSRVCIEGLQSAQAAPMNGRTGIISAEFSADKEGRWTVNIDATGSCSATVGYFRPENLRVTEAAPVAVPCPTSPAAAALSPPSPASASGAEIPPPSPPVSVRNPFDPAEARRNAELRKQQAILAQIEEDKRQRRLAKQQAGQMPPSAKTDVPVSVATGAPPRTKPAAAPISEPVAPTASQPVAHKTTSHGHAPIGQPSIPDPHTVLVAPNAPVAYSPPSGPPPVLFGPPSGPPPVTYQPPSGPPPVSYNHPSGPPPVLFGPPSGPPPVAHSIPSVAPPPRNTSSPTIVSLPLSGAPAAAAVPSSSLRSVRT
jgi:hypothetical protein